MVRDLERREHNRLEIELDLSCRKLPPSAEESHTGRTLNVGPGGLYFSTETDAFQEGNLLEVRLTIPPTPGILESGGSISAFAKVLRTSRLNGGPTAPAYGVAIQFCRRPKLAD